MWRVRAPGEVLGKDRGGACCIKVLAFPLGERKRRKSRCWGGGGDLISKALNAVLPLPSGGAQGWSPGIAGVHRE